MIDKISPYGCDPGFGGMPARAGRAFPRVLKAVTALALMACFTAPAAAQNAESTPAADAQSTATAKAPVVFDLEEIQTDLAAGQAAVNGLRQKVLLNEPQCMIVLLSFEKGGQKDSHSAPGVATITVIDGSIDFQVLGKSHALKAGQVIVLQPDVVHDLKAKEKSTVLVNISKGKADSESHGH